VGKGILACVNTCCVREDSLAFVKPAALRRDSGYAESATPRIGDSGESFFEYEYLREFEAKIGTA
jgi:hypothetical protein